MKKGIQTTIGLVAISLCFAGCATAKQEAESHTSEFDPKSGILTTNYHHVSSRITASGNSKQAIDSMKGSAGKTASIGTSGASQESNQSELIKSIADAIGSIFTAGAQAGAKAATGGVK